MTKERPTKSFSRNSLRSWNLKQIWFVCLFRGIASQFGAANCPRTGKNIRKMSVDVGSKVKANQQVLLLTEDFDAVPDMYGWTKKMRTSLRMDWN